MHALRRQLRMALLVTSLLSFVPAVGMAQPRSPGWRLAAGGTVLEFTSDGDWAYGVEVEATRRVTGRVSGTLRLYGLLDGTDAYNSKGAALDLTGEYRITTPGSQIAADLWGGVGGLVLRDSDGGAGGAVFATGGTRLTLWFREHLGAYVRVGGLAGDLNGTIHPMFGLGLMTTF